MDILFNIGKKHGIHRHSFLFDMSELLSNPRFVQKWYSSVLVALLHVLLPIMQKAITLPIKKSLEYGLNHVHYIIID